MELKKMQRNIFWPKQNFGIGNENSLNIWTNTSPPPNILLTNLASFLWLLSKVLYFPLPTTQHYTIQGRIQKSGLVGGNIFALSRLIYFSCFIFPHFPFFIWFSSSFYLILGGGGMLGLLKKCWREDNAPFAQSPYVANAVPEYSPERFTGSRLQSALENK